MFVAIFSPNSVLRLEDNLIKFSTWFGASFGKNSITKSPEFVLSITSVSSYSANAKGIIDNRIIPDKITGNLLIFEEKIASNKNWASRSIINQVFVAFVYGI